MLGATFFLNFSAVAIAQATSRSLQFMTGNNALEYGMSPDLCLSVESCISSRLESLDPKTDVACMQLRNTLVNHCRLYLCCVDRCTCVFSLPQILTGLGLCSGFAPLQARSALTTVLQVTNFVESLLLGSQTILFLATLPFYISDLHWEEAFFSCISSSPPRGRPSRGL